MPRSRVAQQVLRTARQTKSRQAYPSSTKAALLDSARDLFTQRGYAGTSLDEVVAAAAVTKGALYHHFASKRALFESVFLDVQEAASQEVSAAIASSSDPWERAQTGLGKFLEVCRRPQFRRICMQEGPVALGHERWQEAERQATFGILQRTVDDLLADLDGQPTGLNEAFAVIFYGAIRSAAEFVADAADPEAASEAVQNTIGALLDGLRVLPAD